MNLKFSVGDLTIHRVIEQETSFVPALEMLPGLTPEVLAEKVERGDLLEEHALRIGRQVLRDNALALFPQLRSRLKNPE